MAGLGIDSLTHLASICSHTLSSLQAIAEDSARHYGSFKIDKGNGRFRLITPPWPELMSIQRRLLSFLKVHKSWASCVHGGVPHKSIFTNARPHVRRAMVANLDVKDFFPTTTLNKVQDALERNHLPPDVACLLAKLTTYSPNGGEPCLPQGSPTSTFLANLVFEPADTRFVKLCKRHGLDFTRYVDDITVSGDRDFRDLRGGLVQIITDVGYVVSAEKVLFRGRDKRQIVTGLVVNDRLRPTNEFIWALKRLLRECFSPEGVGIEVMAAEKGLTVKELRASIHGRINHLRIFDKRKTREVSALMFYSKSKVSRSIGLESPSEETSPGDDVESKR